MAKTHYPFPRHEGYWYEYGYYTTERQGGKTLTLVNTMNKAEREALKRLWIRIEFPRPTYLQFRRTAKYSRMMQCWMVRWCGMWMGIENDGHTHS